MLKQQMLNLFWEESNPFFSKGFPKRIREEYRRGRRCTSHNIEWLRECRLPSRLFWTERLERGGPLLTVETEANGDSKSTNEKGPSSCAFSLPNKKRLKFFSCYPHHRGRWRPMRKLDVWDSYRSYQNEDVMWSKYGRITVHCKKSWRSNLTPASGDAGPKHTGVEQSFRHPWRKFYYKYWTFPTFFTSVELVRQSRKVSKAECGARTYDLQDYNLPLYHCATLSLSLYALYRSSLMNEHKYKRVEFKGFSSSGPVYNFETCDSIICIHLKHLMTKRKN